MRLLLTGATGLLGGELLVRLAARRDVERIYAVVRSRHGEPAAQRLQAVFAVHRDAFDPERVVVIDGELVDPRFIAQLAATPGIADVDVVVHAAANTSFMRMNDALIEATNVDALERFVGWAAELPHLQRFAYLGTAMICGTAARPGPISEDESPSPTANHLVPYTSSKARAELALQRALPAARRLVVRPSIVMGDSRPLVPRSPAILWAMAALNRLRLLPVDADAALDIVSVDYAADAICALLFAGASGVYHVSSGPGGATSARRLAATLARHFGGPPFCFVSASLFPSIQRWAKGQAPEEGGELRAYGRYLNYWRDSFCDARRLRAVLAALEPYLRFMELGHVFDNRRLLAATELRTPPPAHIYMEPAMRYLTTIDIVGEAADP